MMVEGKALVAGSAAGPVTAIAPLSFWGGYDCATGLVTDRSHPAFGRSLKGRIVVMPLGRGSSSSGSVLAESIRLGTAPAALVLSAPDSILAVGAMVAETLYMRSCPIVVLSPADHEALARAAHAKIVCGPGEATRISAASI